MIPKYKAESIDLYPIVDYLPVLEPNELDYVYRPNDDSYLLLDALKVDIGEISEAKEPKCILEIGCGSGIIINNYAKWAKESSKESHFFIATDINFDACLLTKKFSDHYKVLNDDIARSIAKKLEGKIDILICNPPYVPTSEEELKQARRNLSDQNKDLLCEIRNAKPRINCIDASYAGGLDGNQITYEILEYSKILVKKGGVFYLLLIEENNPEEIIKRMENSFDHELLLRKKYCNETQYIFKFLKK